MHVIYCSLDPPDMQEGKLSIDPDSTALVIIDLQVGIVGRETEPHSAQSVVENAVSLASKFKEMGMPVFFVHVSQKGSVPLSVISDATFARPASMPENWSDFVPELGVTDSDLVITKRQWGAFYGTDLELQLRRRKISTIVLCGIATSYGVESTARFAYEYGFNQIFPEDAITDMSEDAHRVSVEYILKRIGLVRSTREILSALQGT